MAISEAGAWLQEALLRLCCSSSSSFSSSSPLEPDDVTRLVSFCERAHPPDAKEYLSNLIRYENCKGIVEEYLQRRASIGMPQDVDISQDGIMHVYLKPQKEVENSYTGSKKVSKSSKLGSSIVESKPSSEFVDSPITEQVPKAKSGGGSKGRKGGKGISLREAAEGRAFISRGAPCTCQATRHPLVNNCLSCGRIVCDQEGEGPCTFCGALVLCEGSTYAGLEGTTSVPVSDAEAAAQAFKDRLVEYGRMPSQRTNVIDDQSDYFRMDTWHSEEEKQALCKQKQEFEEAEEARKKKVVVTIDLLGRKVVMVDEPVTDTSFGTGILEGDSFNKKYMDAHIKPNPSVQENPVFIDVKKSKITRNGNASHGGRGHEDLLFNKELLASSSGRVQHDAAFTPVLGSCLLSDGSGNSEWKSPKVEGRAGNSWTEDEACLMEQKPSQQGAFDICVQWSDAHDMKQRLSLSRLQVKQLERRKKAEALTDSVQVLMDGMVLLKSWLSNASQVEIVKECRKLGIGPGGFYQPGYGAENKMHLWMMCLGRHWEPTTRSYEMKRVLDNATSPPIPPMFLELVDECLNAARESVRKKLQRQIQGHSLERSQESDTLPLMCSNVCLANFYEHSGKLGMHQDRDENPESLRQGVPVVSFSLGDSAEFVYSNHSRDMEQASRVLLESGDVLVFGGPSRMVFHGVSRIVPQTAPSWLVAETGLRPGRLNLTFRQS